MWIKDRYGDYYNMDHCEAIIYDSQYNDTYITFTDLETATVTSGDIRDEIIRNIISGTPVMEVR